MNDAARIIANLAILQSSNHAEAVALLAQAITLLPPQPATNATSAKVVKHETVSPVNTNSVSNQLLTRAGTDSTCSACNKAVYKIIANVYDGMTAEQFVQCFKPYDNAPTIPLPLSIWPVDNAVMMDCPLCRGDKTLALWGTPPKVKEQSIESVGSIDYESFQSM